MGSPMSSSNVAQLNTKFSYFLGSIKGLWSFSRSGSTTFVGFFFCEWDVGANGVLFRSLFKGEVVLILVGATKGCLRVFLWSNCRTQAESFFKNRERAHVTS